MIIPRLFMMGLIATGVPEASITSIAQRPEPNPAVKTKGDVKIVDYAGDFCMSGEEIVGVATIIGATTNIPINLIVTPGLPFNNQEQTERFNRILAKSFLSGRIPIMLYCGHGNWVINGPIRSTLEGDTYNAIRWENFPIEGSQGRILIPGLNINIPIPF